MVVSRVGRAADLPEDIARRGPVDQHHRAAGRGGQFGRDLEDELRVGIAFGIEDERPRELGGGRIPVRPGGQRPVAEVGAGQVVFGRDRLPGGGVVCGGEIGLRLARHGVVGMRGSVDHGGRAEADERRPGGDTESAVEHRRIRVRNG